LKSLTLLNSETINAPEGYDIVGVGKPVKGDYFLSTATPTGAVMQWQLNVPSDGITIILKKLPWRAPAGKDYYCLTASLKASRNTECGWDFDNNCYEAGNYYKTEEDAMEAREVIRSAFQSHWKKKYG